MELCATDEYSLSPMRCSGVHLMYHLPINQGISTICTLKPYVNLVTFKLVYGLMH